MSSRRRSGCVSTPARLALLLTERWLKRKPAKRLSSEVSGRASMSRAPSLSPCSSGCSVNVRRSALLTGHSGDASDRALEHEGDVYDQCL